MHDRRFDVCGTTPRARGLMLTIETESGVEIASFEVQNPQAPEQTLKNHVAKSTS
jgi:hypothetical protein